MRFLPLTPIAIGTLLSVAPAWAGDFFKTTVTFVAQDDNVFVDAGETIPSSPKFDFRPRAGNSLFFDNYDIRDTGEQTRSYLAMYKEFDGYFNRITPEAGMVLRIDSDRSVRDNYNFDQTNRASIAGGIRDDGSFLGVNVKLKHDSRISVILFPFDSDRFRLGYSYELSWGGRSSFVLANYVPAVRLAYETDGFYAFAGVKTARAINFDDDDDSIHADENEAVYGFLGGAGYDPIKDHLRLELNGGYFQKGRIPTNRPGLEGKRMNEFGVSAQITYWDKLKPSASVDKQLYRNQRDEALKGRDFSSKPTGYLISTEFTYLSHVLEDFETLGKTKREAGMAGDINAQMQTGDWTFNADVVFRSLEFLVHDTNGLYTFSTVANALDVSPEVFFDVGVDYQISKIRLVPGLSFGIQKPAIAKTKGIDAQGNAYTATTIIRKTKNVLGETTLEKQQLPTNEDASLIYSGRFTLKSYLSDMVTVIGELQLSHNANLVSNDPDKGILDFDDPLVLGVSLMAQARF